MAGKIKGAINYWTIGGFEGEKPICRAIQEAARMGFEGIELCFGAGELAPGVKAEKLAEIKKCARAAGIAISSLCTGEYWNTSLSSPNRRERTQAINFTKAYIETAAALGVKKILVVPGAVAVPWDASRPVVPYAEVWKLSTQSIRALLPTAKKFKVTICVENVWNWFLTDPVAMKTFVKQFKSPQVGCYFDVGNCLINGYAEHWIEVLGGLVKAIHFKNFNREDCGGRIFGFGDDLLKGDVDFPAVMKQLRKINYRGFVVAEMIPFSRLPNLALPDMKMAKNTAKRMKKILSM